MSIDRNDPCPCGSGKKYQDCCIDKIKAFPVKPIPRATAPVDAPFALRADITLPACEKIVGRLLKWLHAEKNRDEVEAAIVGIPEAIFADQDAMAAIDSVLNAWLAFSYRPLQGSGFAARFIEQNPKLTADEAAILRALMAEPIRLVEVQELPADGHIRLRDYFTDEIYLVRLPREDFEFQRWDLLLVHLLAFADRRELTAMALVNRLVRDLVLDAIDDQLFISHRPDNDHLAAMRECMPEVLAAVVEGFQEPGEEGDEDDEDLILHKAGYQVLDERAALRALAKCDEYEVDDDLDDSFRWISRENRKSYERGEAPSTGQIFIDEGTLFLITSSDRDLRDGKVLLEKTAGTYLRHIEDEVETIDPPDAEGDEGPDGEMPDPIEFLRKFADQPMEELDGMTPRAASRDPELRPAISEFLKDMEYVSIHEEGVLEAINRVRRELKLED